MAERFHTVAYRQVKVGDRIYNNRAYHATAAWVRVTAVRRAAWRDSGDDIGLDTAAGYTQWGHAREGITIIREA